MKFYGRAIPHSLRHIFAFLIISIGFLHRTTAQLASGLYSENYSGIHGSIINPAFGPHGYLGWDVNIASGHLFFQNDYAFVTETNLFDLLRNTSEVELINPEDPPSPGDRVLDFTRGRTSTYATLNTDVMGPSFYMDLNRFGIGFYSRARVVASTQRFPGQLGYYDYQNIDLNTATEIPETQIAGLAWTEYGINVASSSLFPDRRISVGLNLKYLIGHEGFYAHSMNLSNLVRVTDNQIELNNTVGELAFTDGLGDTNNLNYQANGRSIGLDLGVSIELDRMRIGVSILDIGKMSFSGNAALHRLVLNSALVIPVDNLTSRTSVDGVVQEINQIVNTAGLDSTLVGKQFGVGLPSRLVLGVDHYLVEDFFVSASLVQRLKNNKNGIHADNSLTVTPRFERRWISFSLPMTVHNYDTFRLGMATRLGLLTIGSDDLMSLFGRRDFNGSSIYVAVKINPFKQKTDERGYDVNCPRIKRSPWNSHEPVKTARRSN